MEPGYIWRGKSQNLGLCHGPSGIINVKTACYPGFCGQQEVFWGMCSMLMPHSKCLQLDKGITSVWWGSSRKCRDPLAFLKPRRRNYSLAAKRISMIKCSVRSRDQGPVFCLILMILLKGCLIFSRIKDSTSRDRILYAGSVSSQWSRRNVQIQKSDYEKK